MKSAIIAYFVKKIIKIDCTAPAFTNEKCLMAKLPYMAFKFILN